MGGEYYMFDLSLLVAYCLSLHRVVPLLYESDGPKKTNFRPRPSGASGCWD